MSKKTSAAAPPPGQPGGIPLPKSRRGVRQYFVDVGREMKKVTWPPHSETNRLTGVVLAVCALLILILSLFHLFFHTIVEILTKSN